MRLAVMLHPAATAKIKHPCRNLQDRKSAQLLPHAAQNCLVASLRLALNPYPLTMPRVPTIQHFALLTFMGVVCLSCSTPSDRTPRWDTAPEAWMINNTGHGEVETATRFPLLHTPDGRYLNSEVAALHSLITGTKHRLSQLSGSEPLHWGV